MASFKEKIPALQELFAKNHRRAFAPPPLPAPAGLGLTLARTGGLVQPSVRFFADREKTAARSAAGFWVTLWGKPCATFGK